jgi:hypothetical protein
VNDEVALGTNIPTAAGARRADPPASGVNLVREARTRAARTGYSLANGWPVIDRFWCDHPR